MDRRSPPVLLNSTRAPLLKQSLPRTLVQFTLWLCPTIMMPRDPLMLRTGTLEIGALG